MARHHLPDVYLDKWESFSGGVKTGEGGVTIEANQDPTCFSIRQTHANGDEEDLIHFCDWPLLRKMVDDFMAKREYIAREDGDWHDRDPAG